MKLKHNLSHGDTVMHKDHGIGVILKQINKDSPSDLRIQGPRYYVKFRSGTWSVPIQVLQLLSVKQYNEG